MWNRMIWIACSFTFISLFLKAQPQDLSLKDCVQYAFEHNHKVRKATLEIQKAGHRLEELKSQALPQISLESDLQYFPQLPTNILTGDFQQGTEQTLATQFGRNINFNTGLEFSQLLYKKGRKLGEQATQQLDQINQLQLTRTQEELAFEIAKLYYQAQLVRQKKGLLTANLEQVNGLMTLLEKQLANGFVKKIDVDQVSVKKSNLESRQYQLELQYNKLMQVLKYQMAMPLDAPINLSDTITETTYELPSPDGEPVDFKSKTAVSLLQTQVAINDLQIEHIRAGFGPTLFFKGAYNLQALADGFGDFGRSGTWFHYGFLGLQLQQPIFDGNKKKAQMAQKAIETQQIREEQAFVEASLELQHNNAQQAIRINLSQLETLDKTRQVAEAVYEVAQKRFSQGIAPITELLSADAARQEAQTNYLAALLQLKIAELELQYARGTLLTTLLQ